MVDPRNAQYVNAKFGTIVRVSVLHNATNAHSTESNKKTSFRKLHFYLLVPKRWKLNSQNYPMRPITSRLLSITRHGTALAICIQLPYIRAAYL